MIPKRIFYCWFGPNEMSGEDAENVREWSRICPDYEIVKVSEDNFDVNSHPFSKLAYEKGNYAFVADVARIAALRHGGIYMDVDTKLLKPLDGFLCDPAFCCACARGFYSNFMLGVDKFPEVFGDTLDVRFGESMNIKMNQALYARYDLLGAERMEFDDIVLYGTKYVANTRTPVCDDTVAINQEENTWLGWWKNGFSPMSDIIPFDIYRDGEFCEGETMSVYGRRGVGRLDVSRGTCVNIDVTELGNYFNNPSVISFEGHGVKFSKEKPANHITGYRSLWGGYTLGFAIESGGIKHVR